MLHDPKTSPSELFPARGASPASLARRFSRTTFVALIDVAPGTPIRLGMLHGTRGRAVADGVEFLYEGASLPSVWPGQIRVEMPYDPEPLA